jgi:hypothetical protein
MRLVFQIKEAIMYLFMSEFSVYQKDNITEENMLEIDHGILSIFKFKDGAFYELDVDGNWFLVEKG